MKGLRYPPLHVTEFCGEIQGKFKVGLARLKTKPKTKPRLPYLGNELPPLPAGQTSLLISSPT